MKISNFLFEDANCAYFFIFLITYSPDFTIILSVVVVFVVYKNNIYFRIFLFLLFMYVTNSRHIQELTLYFLVLNLSCGDEETGSKIINSSNPKRCILVKIIMHSHYSIIVLKYGILLVLSHSSYR